LIQLEKTYLLTILPPGSMKKMTKQKDIFFAYSLLPTAKITQLKKEEHHG